MSILSLFFKNKLEVKQQLADAITKARDDQNLTQDALDEMCFLDGQELPKCSQFEADPSRMSRDVFCRVALPLGLNIDEVLCVELSDPEKLKPVLEDIEANKARVAGCSGGGDVRQITPEELAPVYVLLKILEEMDKP